MTAYVDGETMVVRIEITRADVMERAMVPLTQDKMLELAEAVESNLEEDYFDMALRRAIEEVYRV